MSLSTLAGVLWGNGYSEQTMSTWELIFNLCMWIACIFSCDWLCDPLRCRPPASSVHGIFQVRILEWIAISFSRESSWPQDLICISCLAGRFFTTEPHAKPLVEDRHSVNTYQPEISEMYEWGLVKILKFIEDNLGLALVKCDWNVILS